MTTDRDVLLGVSIGYTYGEVCGFVRSFRRFNQDAHLVLIIGCPNSASDEEFEQHARQQNIELIRPKLIPAGYTQRMNWRYSAYLDHLKNTSSYRKVMLSDVRDVFFQGDPFRPPLPNDVVCAVESLLIGQNRMNAAWLYKAYGADVVRGMLNRRVSCAGTTIGTYAGIHCYCSLMCEQINTHHNAESADQAYHNFIYWNVNPGFMSLDTEEYYFNTLGSKTKSLLEIDQQRVRVDGVESIAVHQYDRHECLSAYVKETYCMD